MWYEEKQTNLGDEFVASINEHIQKIRESPELYPRWEGTEKAPSIIRKATIERFPYLIAFEHHKESIRILAVAHQKRQPLYWITRIIQESN